MNPSRIVITGTIASGKSSLCEILRKKSYQVISADKVNKKLLEVDGLNYGAIRDSNLFDEAFSKEGLLDKKLLAKIIFNDKKKREILNKISHKNIIDYINEKINKSKDDFVFVEIPLFFQMKETFPHDYVWLVKASRDVQISRLMKRDKIGKDYAIKKIKSQNEDIMVKSSDFVFDNSKDLESLEKQVDKALMGLEKKWKL